MLPRLLIAATLAALCHASTANADAIDFELAARVGSATNPGWIGNPYSVGVGGRAGVSIYGFYGGLSALYSFGFTGGINGFNAVLIGLEGGYTFKLPHLRLRPQVCIGNGTFTQQSPDGMNPANPPLSSTVENVFIEPGVVALFPFGHFFFGVDANALLVPGFTVATPSSSSMVGPVTPPAGAKTYPSFSAHGQIGVLF